MDTNAARPVLLDVQIIDAVVVLGKRPARLEIEWFGKILQRNGTKRILEAVAVQNKLFGPWDCLNKQVVIENSSIIKDCRDLGIQTDPESPIPACRRLEDIKTPGPEIRGFDQKDRKSIDLGLPPKPPLVKGILKTFSNMGKESSVGGSAKKARFSKEDREEHTHDAVNHSISLHELSDFSFDNETLIHSAQGGFPAKSDLRQISQPIYIETSSNLGQIKVAVKEAPLDKVTSEDDEIQKQIRWFEEYRSRLHKSTQQPDLATAAALQPKDQAAQQAPQTTQESLSFQLSASPYTKPSAREPATFGSKERPAEQIAATQATEESRQQSKAEALLERERREHVELLREVLGPHAVAPTLIESLVVDDGLPSIGGKSAMEGEGTLEFVQVEKGKLSIVTPVNIAF